MLSGAIVTSKKVGHDSGIIIPVVAVITVAILAVLIGLGFDSAKVKKASSLLAKQTEAICASAAAVANVQRDAAKIFSKQVNKAIETKGFGNVDIVRAKLVIPTMPGAGDFCPFADPGCGASAPLINGGANFRTLDPGIACNLNCTGIPGCLPAPNGDCQFQGSANGDPNYPSSFWNDTRDAGVTTACEITGSVNTWLSGRGRKLISAKSSWWIPVRAQYDISRGDVPGLTIAVAPHMTTDSGDSRFKFCNVGDANCGKYGSAYPGGDNAFRAQFDPLVSPLVAGAGPFSDAAPAQIYPVGGKSIPSIGTLTQPQREQMLAACMNPAVLIRNILLSTIVEHSMRHGQLRSGTELLLVGTQMRYLRGATELGEGIAPANPVQLVKFGEDLAQDSFQLPFVYYDGGAGDLNDGVMDPAQYTNYFPDSYRPLQGGLIDPFTPGGGASRTIVADQSAHYALVANQLRYCYHLYSGSSGGAGSINQREAQNIFNAAFEPPSLSSSLDGNTQLRPSVYTPFSGQAWDQECPWGGSGGCAETTTRKLNASELVSALGTIQKCPAPIGNYPVAGGCSKPQAQDLSIEASTNDLRPDMKGLLLYLAQQAPSATSQPRFYANPSWAKIDFPLGQIFQSILSPGIFPINYGAAPAPVPALLTYDPEHRSQAADPWHPFDLNKFYPQTGSVDLPNPKSAVLIVTHQKLSQLEKAEIRNMVAPASAGGLDLFQGRPITIVYIPTEELKGTDPTAAGSCVDPASGTPDCVTAAHNQAVDDFRWAFYISSSASGTDKNGNAIFVLSPYYKRYNPEDPLYGSFQEAPVWNGSAFAPGPRLSYTGTSEVRYRQYWKDLLSDPASTEENIDIIARNIFYSRILSQDLKF